MIGILLSFKERKQFKERFRKKFKKAPPVSTEEKIKNFVIRNSRNGFFTRLKTISFKFEISEDEALALTGSLLSDGALECVHDEKGEAKLCENGKSFDVQQKEYARMGNKKK